MKKLFFAIAIFCSATCYAQRLDTVSVSVTLRSQDWTWAIGKYGQGTDSVSIVRIRTIRAAILAANPQTWTTNVTLNNVPGPVVMMIYNYFIYAPFGEVLQMGNNTAERTTIYTNIRAINNSALQYFIGLSDGGLGSMFLNSRSKGKNILLDN